MSRSSPRGRDGTFAPAAVPKHQGRIAGFDEAAVSLCAKGMTTCGIAKRLRNREAPVRAVRSDVFCDLVSAVRD